MRILVTEKDRNGRRFLDRMLRLDGHEVIVADCGGEVLGLLEETRPDLVLMNVFQSLHAGRPPVGKISLGCAGGGSPVVFVNCAGECAQLGHFVPDDSAACDSLFDRLPAEVKIGAMERIQQLCSALGRYKRWSERDGNFDWHRAVRLMEAGSHA